MPVLGLVDPLINQTIGANSSERVAISANYPNLKALRKNIYSFELQAKDADTEIRWRFHSDIDDWNAGDAVYRTIPPGQQGGIGGVYLEADLDLWVYNTSNSDAVIDFQATYGVGDGDVRGRPQALELLEVGSVSTASFKIYRNTIAFLMYNRTDTSELPRYRLHYAPSSNRGLTLPSQREEGLTGLWISCETEVFIYNPNSHSIYVEIEKYIGIG